MQNTKLKLPHLVLLGLITFGAGCAFPGVYKIDIQQGNVVTQDMVDQLRPGMTQRQVRFIMGNPLILDTFHPNRWDYLYSIQPGGSVRQQERISLLFNSSEQLVGLSGDFMPGVSRDQALLGEETSPVVTPVPVAPAEPIDTEPAPAPGSLLERIQRDVDSAETVDLPTPEPLDP